MTENNSSNQERIIITRVFDAPRELVWKAWTNPGIVKKWWGPKNFTAPHISIDFKVGGKYLYCMHGAPGPGMTEQDFWSTGIFLEIVPMEKLILTDSFADEQGNKVEPTNFGMSPDFPSEMPITILFEEEGGDKTKLTIQYSDPGSDKAREAMLKSGMEAGWNESLDKLANALK